MPNSETTALKTGKWTEDEVRVLEQGYDPENSDETVAALQKATKRTKRSIIGKLGHMGRYVAPEKPKTVKKDDGPTKGEIETAITKEGFDPDGFSAATKPALKRLLAYVKAHNAFVAEHNAD